MPTTLPLKQSLALSALYLALSCSILLYLAKRQFCGVSLQQRTETGNNPPPPLRSSPLSQGDSQLQPPSVKILSHQCYLCSIHRHPFTAHLSPLIRSPLTSNPLTCDIVAINRGIATLTFNLLFHYGNIQQQLHLGQDPQHRNHRTYGNCNYVWHGELHVKRPPLPFGHLPLYGENPQRVTAHL